MKRGDRQSCDGVRKPEETGQRDKQRCRRKKKKKKIKGPGQIKQMRVPRYLDILTHTTGKKQKRQHQAQHADSNTEQINN